MKKLLLLSTAVALTGCALAPGMKMDNQPSVPATGVQQPQIQPHFIPITPQLIATMHNENNMMGAYRVGPQDVLNIVVWQHPELSYPQIPGVVQTGQNTETSPTISPQGFLVNQDGTIFFPLVGNVAVAGLTTNQIRQRLTSRLMKYVRSPQLDVRVTGFRNQKIYVMGEILKPGLQPITDVPMSVTDAINLAGGLDPQAADPSHIYIIRGSITSPNVYWLNAQSPDSLLLAENFILQSHDVVFVSTTDMARWNRAINLILPTIQTLWFTGSIINHNE